MLGTGSQTNPTTLDELRAITVRALTALDWEVAVAHLSALCERLRDGSPDLELECWILSERAWCHKHLGDLVAQVSDLDALDKLAVALGDEALRAHAACRRAVAEALMVRGQVLVYSSEIATSGKPVARRLCASIVPSETSQASCAVS